MLQLGQIKYLYMLVHPAWSDKGMYADTDAEMKSHFSFVDKLVDNDQCALVHVEGYIPGRHSLPLRKRFAEFDRYAMSKLHERYYLREQQTHTRDANFITDVGELVEYFNLQQQDHESRMSSYDNRIARGEKYLTRVITYGKRVGLCPFTQAALLRNDAKQVFHTLQFVPDQLEPLTDESSQKFVPRGDTSLSAGNILIAHPHLPRTDLSEEELHDWQNAGVESSFYNTPWFIDSLK